MPDPQPTDAAGELERLQTVAIRFRRAATLVKRTSKTTLIQWPSAEVDAFIAAFPISEDKNFTTPVCNRVGGNHQFGSHVCPVCADDEPSPDAVTPTREDQLVKLIELNGFEVVRGDFVLKDGTHSDFYLRPNNTRRLLHNVTRSLDEPA